MTEPQELFEKFRSLIEERDQIPYHQHEQDARCREIDDILIPSLLKQIGQAGQMQQFNEFVSSWRDQNNG